jgi:hypothetical protein
LPGVETDERLTCSEFLRCAGNGLFVSRGYIDEGAVL